MKKTLVAVMALLCSSCQLEGDNYATLSDMLNTQPQAEQAQYQVVEQQPQIGKISDPVVASGTRYSSDYERYRQNIVVKAAGPNFVVYEYTDVRVDEVASLASAYCFETTGYLKAYLRDIYMYRNHKRRATFDCVDLASQ